MGKASYGAAAKPLRQAKGRQHGPYRSIIISVAHI
jgi:hypothetical protein